MAKLKTLNIYPYSSATYYAQQKAFFNIYSYDGSLTYMHMKTNIPTNQYDMWMVEAVGYAFGNSQSIRCAWSWYTYPPSAPNELVAIGLENVYPGMTAHGVYKSSDNYVCLRAYTGGFYYAGFILNGYCTRENSGRQITISAYAQNNTSGSHY